jgi:hypothetical protein
MFQKQTDQCSDVRSILKDELETKEKITLRLYQFDLGEIELVTLDKLARIFCHSSIHRSILKKRRTKFLIRHIGDVR